MFKRFLPVFLALGLPQPALADAAPFDLTGPGLRIAVTRGGATLPIAEVPNLAAGDRIAITADLPADQGARYLMVAGFLRGATNPPPKDWFFQAQTWKEQAKKNALDLTVPEGAGQLLVFLAPDTGGFDPIVAAVRKQPGAFVRAAQELSQASLDRARLDTFVAGIRRHERDDPERIEAVSPVLTHALAIKLKSECLDQPADLQAACLTQNGESLVLADSQSSSLADKLVGTPTDLALQIAATPQGGYGYYSPYIGVVRDLARLFGAFQSTEFKYIPALARLGDDHAALLLNAAPSFAKPKSVLVVALPAIEPPRPPALRRSTPDVMPCADGDDLLLPVEGAPLVYATPYAHDTALRMTKADGSVAEVPVTADAERGGFVVAKGAIRPEDFPGVVDAALHGRWGFGSFEGPRFRIAVARGGALTLADPGAAQAVIGRDATVMLKGAGGGACLASVAVQDAAGTITPLAWKAAGEDRVTVTLPLDKAKPGKLTLLVGQRGVAAPDRIAITALREAARLDGFVLHAGDAGGELAGARLDGVISLVVNGVDFRPGTVERIDGADRLLLTAGDPGAAARLVAGAEETAQVKLADGRTLALRFTVAPPRAAATLIGRTIARADAAPGTLPIVIDDTVVPADARLTFSLHAGGATRFTGRESIEIATADGRASGSVTAANGFTLQSEQVAVVSVEPGRLLGPASFGPLRVRVVQGGVAGDWIPLGSLVRLPVLTGLACAEGAETCTLSGSDLFLLAAIAADPGFAGAETVPDGFTATSLAVPRPAAGKLFLRLRDDAGVLGSVEAGK